MTLIPTFKGTYIAVAVVACNLAAAGMACEAPEFLQHFTHDLDPCHEAQIGADRDQDGIVDWQVFATYGNQAFPVDEDLDNDGLLNLSDAEPTTPSHQGPKTFTIRHPQLIAAHSRGDLRVQLEALGVTAFPLEPSPAYNRALHALRDHLQALASQGLERDRLAFKQIILTGSLYNGRALAVYIEPLAALVVSEDLLQESATVIRTTIAHELGHAFIFANFTAQQLAKVASQYGGWRLPDVESLYAAELLEPINSKEAIHENFPTTYSYQSVHEWVAEIYAHLTTRPNRHANFRARPPAFSFKHFLGWTRPAATQGVQYAFDGNPTPHRRQGSRPLR